MLVVGQHRIGLVTICSDTRFEKLWPIWGMVVVCYYPREKYMCLSVTSVNWKRMWGWSRENAERECCMNTQGPDYAKNFGF